MFIEEEIRDLRRQIGEMRALIEKLLILSTPRERVTQKEAEDFTGLHRNTLLKYRQEGILTDEPGRKRNFYYKDELEKVKKKGRDETVEGRAS